MTEKSKGFWHRLGVDNALVFYVVIISAVIIVGARLLAPFEVGKDQSAQLEAAQRLATHLGLTTTDVAPRSFDITEIPEPKLLTAWPPGFSVLVACFLTLGLPLLWTLKIIFGATTLIGWAGWAIIASHFLARPVELSARKWSVNLLLAALLPVFCTLWWGGTDILLWAAVPYIFLLLFRSGKNSADPLLVLLAGLLFGMSFAIRYASLFIGMAAFLILFQVNLPDLRKSLQKFAVFCLGALIVIAAMTVYLKSQTQPEAGLALNTNLPAAPANFSQTIKDIFICLPFASILIFGLPLVDQFVYQLYVPSLMYITGAACLLMIIALPLFLLKNDLDRRLPSSFDMGLGLAWLPLSLVTFLIALKLAGYGDLLKVRRYYEPLELCGVFVFYEIASRRAVPRPMKMMASVVVGFFLAYLCLYTPSLALIPERRGALISEVFGYMPANDPRYPSTSQNIGYPSRQLYSRKERSKQQMRFLAANYPQALFFIDEYGYFIYDGSPGKKPTPGKDLRVYQREAFWQQAYTSKPVKVFWVLQQDTALDFIPAAQQTIVFQDPVEKTKIIATDFPEGYKFSDMKASEMMSRLHQP